MKKQVILLSVFVIMILVFSSGCSSYDSPDSETSDSSYSSETSDSSSDSEESDISSENEDTNDGSDSEDASELDSEDSSEPDSEDSECEDGYSPCVPKYPPDLDCADIGEQVEVTGSDPHGLDRDSDGVGCESY